MAIRGYRNQSIIPLGSSSGPLSVARNSVTLGDAENMAGANISGMVTGKFFIDIEWRSSITDFVFADISIENGTASASDLTSTSGRLYRLGITPMTDSSGIVTVTISEDAVTGGNDFAVRSYGYSTVDVTPSNAAYVRFDLPDGIQTGTTYNVDCTFRRGASTIEVIGFTNAATDIVTEGISGVTQIITTRGWELTLPASVTNLQRSQIAVTGQTVSSVRRVGTEGTDAQRWVITLTGGTTGGFLETLATSAVTISGQGSVTRPTSIRSRAGTYRLVITPPQDENGTLNTVIRQGAVQVASDSTPSPAIDTNSGSVGFDTRTPVTFTLGDPEDTSGNTLSEPLDEGTFFIDITSDKQASSFAQRDVVVSNACWNSFDVVTSGMAWRIGLSPNAVGRGQIGVSISSGAVSEGNHTVSRNYEFVREAPSPQWTLPDGIQTRLFPIGIVFSNGIGTTLVTGLTDSDFEVTGISGSDHELRTLAWKFTLSRDVDSFSVSNISVTDSSVHSVALDGRVVTLTLTGIRSTLARGDISLTGLESGGTPLSPQPTVSNFVRQDYTLVVTPPPNQEGTLNVVLARNSCTSVQGVQGPPDNENSGSIAFDTKGAEPDVDNIDWPDNIPVGAGTFFVDVDFNELITDFMINDLILDAPSSVSITSISWGTTSITDQPNRAMRTRASSLANVGADGQRYYRINLTTTSAYAGENVQLFIRALGIRGPQN